MRLTNTINPNIFRGYDIRGIVDQDLTDDSVYTLARAYATFLHTRRITEAVIGRDNRLSSDRFSAIFIQGLNDGGINTVDIGLSLSQIVYFSGYYFRTKGSVMITASHNPKEYNGFKLGVGYSDTMVSEEIQWLKETIQTGKIHHSSLKGTSEQQDIFKVYQQDILKHFSLKNRWKIVIDGCDTGSGVFYPPIFRAAGCEVIEQNCIPDGHFPHGVPDPTEKAVLERLASRVKSAKADIGFAYDTDGDRMSVVDEKGDILWMDSIVALFAKDILDYLPGSKIVYNTLCSRQVTETIEQSGGLPIMWLTGHSFIKAKVKEERAPFGGELSGHIFFMDNFYGHDDGAYASLRLLQYLERQQETLSQAQSKLPFYVSSPEIKLGLADEIKFQLIDDKIKTNFKEVWPNAKFSEIEGIRMDNNEAMCIVRASQNGPYITIKYEGKTQEIYDQIKIQIRSILKKYPEIDWSKGVNTDALD